MTSAGEQGSAVFISETRAVDRTSATRAVDTDGRR
jgi:hypothetical protein